MRHFLRTAVLLLASLTVGPWPSPGRASDALPMLSQYGHRAWRVQEGTLPLPTAIAQTPDGYLWVGTKNGLLRFDGLRFVEAEVSGTESLRGARIWSLLAMRNGDLWVGASDFVGRLRNGRLQRFRITGRAMQIVADGDDVWFVQNGIGTGNAFVCSIVAEAMTCYGRPEIPLNTASAISKAEEGFWIGSTSALCHWIPHRHADCFLQSLLATFPIGITSLEALPDRSLLVGIGYAGPDLGLGRFVDGKWSSLKTPNLDGSTLPVAVASVDRSGSIWVGTGGHGLYRIHDGVAERFGVADGLTSDTVDGHIVEDREGTIWVTTPAGLDAFRRLPVTVYSEKEGLSTDNVNGVLAAVDGTVWLTGLQASTIVENHVVASPTPLPANQSTSALLQDRRGRIWMGVGKDMAILEHDRLRFVTDRQHAPAGGLVQALAEDANGDLYALTVGQKGRLLRIVDDVIVDETPRDAGGDPLTRIGGSPVGGVWAAFTHGGWTRIEDGHVGSSRRDPDQTVFDIDAHDKDAVLVATGAGLMVERGPLRRRLDTAHGLPCQQTSAVIRASTGAVFVAAECGIIVIDAGELDRWFTAPDTRVKSRLLDATDGVRVGTPYYTPRASRDVDGRLWFATGSVAEMVDPATLSTRPPPPVRIEEMVADRATRPLVSPLTLSPGTRDIAIRYTALSFIAPERIAFQYRLDGRDKAWHDAGTRRETFYTDLPPGSYRFHVRSADGDGRWDERDASLDFTIEPLYYQTRWFLFLCIGVGALLLYGFYVVRLRQAAATERSNAAIQNQERIRIARELHDTLLQSTQGLVLRFQRATSRIPPTEPARELMERALDRADDVIRESRQRVQKLRTDEEAAMDLSASLASIVKELGELDGADRLSMTTSGAVRLVDGPVGAEIVMIVREALTNAIAHSKASRIEANIAYESSALHVTVVDDGVGLSEAMMAGGREGHWGLASMRERAAALGARLEIRSSAGTGTLLTLATPAAVAYFTERSQPAPWWNRVRRYRFGAGRDRRA